MNELPQRKHPRWKSYDYSRNGAYFITICTYGRAKILSDVVGRGLAPAEIRLSKIGEIVEKELFALEQRYDYVNIGPFVVMPNHIHVIFVFNEGAAGASLFARHKASLYPALPLWMSFVRLNRWLCVNAEKSGLRVHYSKPHSTTT